MFEKEIIYVRENEENISYGNAVKFNVNINLLGFRYEIQTYYTH